MQYLDQVVAKLSAAKPMLVREYHIATLGLFGSVVRNDFNERTSDIDIIAEFSQPIGIEFIDLAEKLEQLLQRKVDLVSRRAIKPSYFTSIQAEIVYV